jgi:hypothetical protein
MALQLRVLVEPAELRHRRPDLLGEAGERALALRMGRRRGGEADRDGEEEEEAAGHRGGVSSRLAAALRP